MRQDHATYSLSVRPAAIDLDGYSHAMAQAQQTVDCGDVFALDVDEKNHGTSSDNANSIVREGFDHRTRQRALSGAEAYRANITTGTAGCSCGAG